MYAVDTDHHPKEVLWAMKGYVLNFVRCRQCGENFKKEIVDLEKNITTSDDAILYLWRLHNKVNKRLHDSEAEDPNHPKVQFPTVDMCPPCHKADNPEAWNEPEVLKFLKRIYSTGIFRDTDDTYKISTVKKKPFINVKDPKFRKDLEIFNKKKQERKGAVWDLEEEFGDNNIDMQRRLAKSKIEKIQQDALFEYSHNTSQLKSWGLNNIDISMCIAFYFFCTALILLVYFHFVVKKKISLKQVFVNILS